MNDLRNDNLARKEHSEAAADRRDRETIGESLLDRVGNTPLLQLSAISREAGITVVAKAEWVNPGGSVKDRAAAAILTEAQASGKLRPGMRLLDSTSGNTGIAYAMLGAAMGVPVTLCVPENVSPERKHILRAFGAEIIWTDAADGSDGAIRRARLLASAQPDLYFYADQYGNPENWRAHYRTTAEEIWRQTHGRITHFIAMLGTSGTFIGTARRLKELNPRIQCISLQPDSPFHGIEGAKYMPTSIVPRIYDPEVADRNLEISTEASYAMVKRLAHEGLLVGISAGAAVVGCLEIAKAIAEPLRCDSVMVTVFPDSADKYLSERFWETAESE